MNDIPVDIDALEELRSIMGEDFRLLIDTFIVDSNERMVAIEKAIDSTHPENLRGAAHSFKGSSLNMSAAKLTELCRQLEYMGRDNEFKDARQVFEAAKVEFDVVKNYLLSL